MKLGKVPMASVILLIFSTISLTARYFYPLSYHSLSPYFDGGMIGALLVYGLYYANIYVGAWLKNRKVSTSLQNH